MHFPIIKLESLETEKADFETSLDYEDSTLNMWTDYYGELYTDSEREKVIKSNWLKEIFDGVATVDTEKETVTFLDSGTIRQTFREYLLELTTKLHEEAERGELRGFELRYATVEYKEFDAMFYIDCGYTCFELIENAEWHAGETWKIGNIFDAHF